VRESIGSIEPTVFTGFFFGCHNGSVIAWELLHKLLKNSFRRGPEPTSPVDWIERELNRRPLLFEGTTPIFSVTSWRPVLDVPQWSRNGISGPGDHRGSQIQFSSADWGSSVQIFPRPGFHTMPAFPGGHSLTCRFCCGLQTTPYPASQDALGWKDKYDACFELTQQLKKNTRSNRMVY
jgi:hypothetical protein